MVEEIYLISINDIVHIFGGYTLNFLLNKWKTNDVEEYVFENKEEYIIMYLASVQIDEKTILELITTFYDNQKDYIEMEENFFLVKQIG